MLERLFHVRQGEATRTVLLFTYLFLVVTSYVVTKATRDAMFLERYHATALPYADIASAVAVGLVMAVYIRIGRVVGMRLALIGSLLTFSSTSFMFWLITRGEEPRWILPALYVWAGVFGVMLPAQVWTLANYVLTTREAKRLYGVIGSGAISGWIVGGFITKTAATHLGTPTLLLMTGLALGLCPPLVIAIWRTRPQAAEDDAPSAPASADDHPRGLSDSFRLVWRSPHLRAIAAVIFLSSLVTTVAAWQFRAIAKQYFPETDALTAFFGTFNVYAGLLSLGTQLFLTSRLLRRFGLGVALFVVPIALTAGSLGVLIWGGIGAAVLLKGSDQVLRYSIDRSTVELLYLPVPARQTFQAKAFIDTVVWRTGDCLGALLVLAAVTGMGLTAPQISIVTIVLLTGWMSAAWVAEGYYVENLRTSLHEHRMDAERLESVVIERSTAELLANALGSGKPEDIVYALDLLPERELPSLQGAGSSITRLRPSGGRRSRFSAVWATRPCCRKSRR